MITKLIAIGNSRGLRLPKTLIDKYHIEGEMNLIESDNGILIQPISKVREGWDEMFKAAKNDGVKDDDFSDFMSVTNEFDSKEWN